MVDIKFCAVIFLVVVVVVNVVVVVVRVKYLGGVIVELESDKGGIEVGPEHSWIHDFRILFNVDLQLDQTQMVSEYSQRFLFLFLCR